jgi:serine/threonine-protein kinase RsbW
MRLAGLNRHLAAEGGKEHAGLGAGTAESCDDAMSATVVSPEASARLDSVHYTLEGFWQRLGESAADEWKMLFELAVCEIAANIIEHARADVMEFDICITRDGNRVIAEFTDTGQPYPRADRPKRRDEYDERGRGLKLARTVLDELIYERTGSTNSWRLVKQL